jgi:hypothetical protein
MTSYPEVMPRNKLFNDAGPKSASGTSPRSPFLDSFRLADQPSGIALRMNNIIPPDRRPGN